MVFGPFNAVTSECRKNSTFLRPFGSAVVAVCSSLLTAVVCGRRCRTATTGNSVPGVLTDVRAFLLVSRSELPSARLTGSAGSAVAEALPNGVDKSRWDELAAKRPYSSRGSLAVQSLCSASFARHLLGLFSVWCARFLAGLKSGPRADTVFWPSRIQFIDRLSGRAGGDGRQLQSAPAFQSLDSPFALHISSSPEFASSIRRQLR